jgi:diguanylate cyclase (GGDEF)-like protein/PAS domain S-box-containing protein
MFALWGRAALPARTIVLVALAVLIEGTAIVLYVTAAIIVNTAVWHAAIVGYLTVGWLNELDVLGMLARSSQQRFQNIAMSLSDGVVCTDGRGVVTFWNPGAAAIFGFASGEVMGRPLTDFCRSHSASEGPEPSAKLAGIGQMLADGPMLELMGVRKGGDTFPLEASISGWPDLEGGVQYGVVLRDITARKREEEQMRYLAMHDSLTGLANRASFRAALSSALECSQGGAVPVALVLIDLDNFKDINDTLGHQGGDAVLLHVAGRLRELSTAGELVGRFGGDEFAVVVQGHDAAARAETLAAAISSALKHTPVVVDGHPFFPGATIGVAMAARMGEAADDLFVNADLALYRAKDVKRGSHVVYSPDLRMAREQRRTLEAELHQAVDRGEFELFYQPQIRLRDSTLVGVEALIRWRHPSRGLLAPGQFLDVLNASTLSDEVGRWVLEHASRQGRRWHQMGHKLRVGVNLSPSQFRSDLLGLVRQVLAETGFQPEFLELEVTENILLDRDRMAAELLRQVQDLGVRIAFDDFGTGYASLTHLKRFPLDRLKIDRSFVRDLEADSGSAAIVAAIGGLGKRLGLSIIAEGVEDARLLAPLLKMGCDEAQGYLFGKPMEATGIERMLEMADRPSMAHVPTAA